MKITFFLPFLFMLMLHTHSINQQDIKEARAYKVKVQELRNKVGFKHLRPKFSKTVLQPKKVKSGK